MCEASSQSEREIVKGRESERETSVSADIVDRQIIKKRVRRRGRYRDRESCVIGRVCVKIYT